MDPLTLFVKALVGSIILLVSAEHVNHKIRRYQYGIKTGDFGLFYTANNLKNIDHKIKFEKFNYTFDKTTYADVIKNIGSDENSWVFTHRILRRIEFKGSIFYYNKEVAYFYEEFFNFENQYVKAIGRKRQYILHFFFRDNILVKVLILDKDAKSMAEKSEYYVKSDIHYDSYLEFSRLIDYNHLYYKILSLKEFHENWRYASGCDFYEESYWDDPEIEWERLLFHKPTPKHGPYVCGASLLWNHCTDIEKVKTRKQILAEQKEEAEKKRLEEEKQNEVKMENETIEESK
jgi:hypothetical protein